MRLFSSIFTWVNLGKTYIYTYIACYISRMSNFNFIFIRSSNAFLLILNEAFMRRMWGVAFSKGSDMIFEGPFVLKIWTTSAIPQLSAVLFVSPPIPFNCKGFWALSAHEWFCTMLSFVVRLESSEVLQGLSSWMIDVVLATLSTTVTW